MVVTTMEIEAGGGQTRSLQRWTGRHRRFVFGAAAVIVLGGAGLFWGLSSSASPSRSTAALASPHGPSADGADVPIVGPITGPASATDAPGASTGAESGGSVALACPLIPSQSASDPTDWTGSSSSAGSTGEVGSATHVFTRSTADGVEVRVYSEPSVSPCQCATAPSGPTQGEGVTSSSQTTAFMDIELSDTDAVGNGGLSTESDASGPTTSTSSASAEPVAMTSGAFGVVEGDPVWWVAVSVGAEVAKVQMTFPDGSSDVMAPVDGMAVVAHSIDPSEATSGSGPYAVRGTLQLLDQSGAVINTITLPEAPPNPVPLPLPTPVETGPTLAPTASSTGSTGPVAAPPALPTPSIVCPGVVAPAPIG